MGRTGEIALLSARALVRAGDDGAPLFEPLDLDLAPGERLALRGPSGSGKTLVLRALTLLDPADGGDIRWRGEPIADAEVPAHRRRVHLLAQSAPLVDGTVRDNLALPFELAVADDERDDDRALALLDRFGTAALFDRPSADLSGGERQMVALIRALLIAPSVLLLDEPTTALDPERAAVAEELVGEWHADDPERASIWVSHDAAQIDRVTDRRVTITRA